jgi:hypothetical protein
MDPPAMSPLRKSLWVCCMLLLTLRIAQHHNRPTAHNPLEHWRTEHVHVADPALLAGAGGEGVPSIRCNVSVLEGAHQWVEVSWSGLESGAICTHILA